MPAPRNIIRRRLLALQNQALNADLEKQYQNLETTCWKFVGSWGGQPIPDIRDSDWQAMVQILNKIKEINDACRTLKNGH